MPRPKEILRTCHPDTAKRQRRCAQNSAHTIAAGERCLVFEENMRTKSYCLSCARRILDRGLAQLRGIIDEL